KEAGERYFQASVKRLVDLVGWLEGIPEDELEPRSHKL
ncbi:unnamed protein product, partial [marine sediment metagenome]